MKVLFICTANSCRSQMAEAWARRLFPPGWEAASAGLVTYPISEKTRRAMAEVGIDMAGQYSKSLEAVDLDAFDLVVTLSEQAGRFLPRLRHPERHLHRPLPDPMGATGRPDDVARAFAEARDRIGDLVRELVAEHGGGRPGDSPA